ncbi:MAG: efflux RND transporter periplasmic adaptor subunit, partial [Lentisphaeria bacterium]
MKTTNLKFKQFAFFIIALIIGGVLTANFLQPQNNENAHNHSHHHDHAHEEEDWTCAMHPQVKLPKSGKCPLCFMDLVKVDKNAGDEGPRELIISDYAQKLIELETAEVVREFAEKEVRLLGKVEFDETKVTYISSWMPGRLDKLLINFTGIAVRKGEPMAEIYSPELITAQEELLQAKSLKISTSALIQRTAEATLNAAREKLRLLGLSSEKITEIETLGKANEKMILHAPSSGIVIAQNALEGKYVQTGTPIFTVANLSSVWLKIDAYESDLPWIRYGSKVEFTTESQPGKTFSGLVSFTDPIIDNATRTAKIRVSVNNSELLLKPGMFIRATIRSKIDGENQIVNPFYDNKWISPKHPEIVKNEPGKCDLCESELVPAQSFGYAKSENLIAPILVPEAAVLKTGRRAVVYLQKKGHGKTSYEGREVILGTKVRNSYIVKSGLYDGDLVVTRGAFKLDSELQIQARPSMMSEDGEKIFSFDFADELPAGKLQIPGVLAQLFVKSLNSYFNLQESLASDDSVKSFQTILLLAQQFENAPYFENEIWQTQYKNFTTILTAMKQERGIKKQRDVFKALSQQFIRSIKSFEFELPSVYLAYCGMAFNDTGAEWLQRDNKVFNPYWGHRMLRCGRIIGELG